MPSDVAPLFAEISFTQAPGQQTDFLLEFIFSLTQMKQAIVAVNQQKLLLPNGYFYLAYPKVQSKQYTGIKRDDIFPFLDVNEETGRILTTDLKFSRMLRLDDNFTLVGLRWITTTPRSTNRASQRVADYQTRVAELQVMLRNYEVASQFFNQLAPGYQREWARFVFSPKTSATQAKHFQQMIEILNQGFFSITLYRQRN